MDFNKLSAGDRRFVILAAIVIFGGLIGVTDNWGFGATVGLLAGIGVALVVLQPQLMPTMKLPIAKSQLIFALSLVAAGGFILAGLSFLKDLFDFTRIYSILFDIGLIASIVLAWFAWLDFKVDNPEMAAKIAAAMPSQAADDKPAAPAAAAAAPASAPAPKPVAAPERAAAPEPVVAPEAAEPMTAAESTDTGEPLADVEADAADAPEAAEDAPKVG
jgi:hypothetical protein